jgi:monofunctional biosynthetic peptidoglycan transglycosylase
MGGRSQSSFLFDPTSGCAVFRGVVTFENGGGFASVRSSPFPHDLQGCSRFVVGVKGDGKRYHFRVKLDESFGGVVYDAPFEATQNFTEIELLFQSFVPVVRGRVISDAPPLGPSVIWSLGLLIGDRQAGPFRLEVHFISAL